MGARHAASLEDLSASQPMTAILDMGGLSASEAGTALARARAIAETVEGAAPGRGFSLVLSVIVDLEGSLRSHEVWVGLGVVVGGHLLAVQCQTYYGSYIILGAMHTILDKFVQALVLTIKVVGGLVEPIHILLTLRNISWWHIVGWACL